MYKDVYNLLREVLFFAFALALAVGTAIGIYFGRPFLEPFILGAAIGFLNFILLSLSMHFLVNLGGYKARNLYTVFFIIRYAIIFFVIYNDALINVENVIFIFIGISMLLSSIVISAFIKHFAYGKESKNGRSESGI